MPRPAIPVTIDGTDYPSLAAAARALGVSKQALAQRLQRARDAALRKVRGRVTVKKDNATR